MTDPRRVASAEEQPPVVIAEEPTSTEAADEPAVDSQPMTAEELTDEVTGPADGELAEVIAPDEPAETLGHGPTEAESVEQAVDLEPEAPAEQGDAGVSDDAEAPEAGAENASGGGWWGPMKAQLAELGAKAAALNEPAPDTEVDPGNEFSLWSELGVYEPSPEEAFARDYDPKRRQALYWLIGGVSFVVIVSVLFTLGLFSSERELYRSVTSASPTSIEAPEVTESSEPVETPSEEPSQEPSPTPTPTPAALRTPTGMVAGTKQCAEGLWSGPQTSCNLAQATADQLDRTITTPVEIQAFSSTTNRNYRLQCTPGEGITCVGLDGVNGVVIYIAAP